MKKILVRLFIGWGNQNLVMCCWGSRDEVEVPNELLEQLK